MLLNVTDDKKLENVEQFVVTLSVGNEPAVAIDPRNATVSISDNDGKIR